MVIIMIALAVLAAQFLSTGDDTPAVSAKPDTPGAGCRLAVNPATLSEVDQTCHEIASDTTSDLDPVPFWGLIDCEESSREQVVPTGGDPHSRGDGHPQGNEAFRRLTVYDGDDVYGERCELGHNNIDAPNAFYHEGQHRITYISLRLDTGVDPAAPYWRTVMQMKQAQPYNNPTTSPIFELQTLEGKWAVQSSWTNIWNAPAQAGVWTRFAFDMVYSQDPKLGSVTVYVDLDGDGDATDPGEQSPTIHLATLRAETKAGSPSPFSPGDSIPSHLRAGIYHDDRYQCPAPTGCSVDVDNVQVIEP